MRSANKGNLLSTLLLLPAVIALLAALTGCGKAPDIANPLRYDKDGIGFAYPANWRISDSGSNDSIRYVVAEGPGEVLFIAQVYPRDKAVPLHEFAQWFSAEARGAMPFGEARSAAFADIEKDFGETRLSGIREELSIVLLGMQVPHLREYFVEESADQVTYLISQSSSEDWPVVEPGLRLIIATFAAGAWGEKETPRRSVQSKQ